MAKKLKKFEPRQKVLRNKKITITTTHECAQELYSLAKEAGISQSNIPYGKEIVAELHRLHCKVDEKIDDKEILTAAHTSIGKIANFLNSHIENLKEARNNGDR